MDRLRRDRLFVAIVVALFTGVLVLALADSAKAQGVAVTAEVKKVVGQVEALKKGQGQWVALASGAKLVEGDEIRSQRGGSAEIALPDGSTLFLAENSRLVVNKLDWDGADQSRTGAFHLVAGKVRALVSKASISLLRSRQSNFVISTPTAVAAARGTHYEVLYDAVEKKMRVVALPEPDSQGASASQTSATRTQ